MDIHHLDGGEFFENGARRQARRQSAGSEFQRHLQAVGDESDENVGLDAMVELMINRADAEIALEFLEGLFDLGELDVMPPQSGGIAIGEVGAQQITALAASRLAQFFLAQAEAEGLRGDRLAGIGKLPAWWGFSALLWSENLRPAVQEGRQHRTGPVPPCRQ